MQSLCIAFFCTAPWISQLLSIEKTDLNNTLNKNPIQFDISDVGEKNKTKKNNQTAAELE